MNLFIGIDLAWGEKNPSGFCVLQERGEKLEIVVIKLLYSLDDIIEELEKYKDYQISLGIDAPLVIPNSSGNREIEKEFNKDFSKYKISMLPVNRTLLTKYSKTIRSEVLYKRLVSLGYQRDLNSAKNVFEVYTHSTIALVFNNKKILPYKRKKGRDTAFIKKQLIVYKTYLEQVANKHAIFEQDIETLKGKKLKDYEDMLDAFTCAFTMYLIQHRAKKIYKIDGIDTFITLIEET